ncbi:hypothetical protein BDZ97DRAFT_1981611 [Flammula alnicola]|nr:hypothetical protein BDZ97DRAFT_1981611 [Flammula alnicola]
MGVTISSYKGSRTHRQGIGWRINIQNSGNNRRLSSAVRSTSHDEYTHLKVISRGLVDQKQNPKDDRLSIPNTSFAIHKGPGHTLAADVFLNSERSHVETLALWRRNFSLLIPPIISICILEASPNMVIPLQANGSLSKHSRPQGYHDERRALDYLSEPTLAETCPTEHDGRYLLARLYSDEPKMNWCRALDQNLVIRVVSRSYGVNGTNAIAKPGMEDAFIGLPTPKILFDAVWKIVPDFVKTRITQWAKANMDGPIANELTSYVKQGLAALPIPIPSFFVNAVANLAIPPLVSYIIANIANLADSTTLAIDAPLIFPRHTAKSLKVMRNFDRRILLAAGLKAHHLPAHLSLTASDNSAAGADDNFISLGQPDDRDSRTDMEQFYQSDVPNGSKPLQLTQVIAAQFRTNPACDQDADTFGLVVWKSLDDTTRTTLRGYAQARPPKTADIADALYTPVCKLLQKDPYNVPSPILNSFSTMKVTEATEYVIAMQK